MRFLAVLAALLLLAALPPAAAKSDAMMGEDIFIEWDPHILTLAPGEEGDVTITVFGNRESTTMVGIKWNYIDGPGGPDGEVSPDYFVLGSHDEVDVNVHVRSRAVRGAGECASDVRLTFHWGPNLTVTEDGFDRDSAEGWEDLQIHVTDVFDRGGDGGGGDGMEGVLLAVIVVLLLVIVGLLVKMNSMRG